MFLSLQTRNLSLQKMFVTEDKQNIHFLIYNNSKQSYYSIKNYFIHNHLIYIQDLIWNNIWKQKKVNRKFHIILLKWRVLIFLYKKNRILFFDKI